MQALGRLGRRHGPSLDETPCGCDEKAIVEGEADGFAWQPCCEACIKTQRMRKRSRWLASMSRILEAAGLVALMPWLNRAGQCRAGGFI
jgi:hypothetical protein